LSCSQEGSVEKTSEGFLSAIVALDFESARKYVTQESLDDIRLVEAVVDMIPKEQIGELRRGSYFITGYEIDEDNALVYYTASDDEEHVLRLEKMDGKWLIRWKQEF
jgi:hypothetical protein